MTNKDRPVEINMSGIPVAGVGGLGLVAVTLMMAFVFPEARGLLMLGVVGGIIVAAGLVTFRRRHLPSDSDSNNQSVLFRPEPTETSAHLHSSGSHKVNLEELVAQTR
jgi:hypothetical protein